MLSKFASSCAAGVCLIPTLFGTICLRLGPGQTVCKTGSCWGHRVAGVQCGIVIVAVESFPVSICCRKFKNSIVACQICLLAYVE